MQERNRLSDELKKYGYVFSVKRTIVLLAVSIVTAIGVALFLRLKGWYLGCFISFVIAFLPLFIRNAYKNRYEQQRFSDANTYIEQFLYSFQKSGKIVTTLGDVGQLFVSGMMHDAIEECLDYIEHAYNDDEPERNGLKIIEDKYPADQIQSIHHFALMVERDGGEYDESVLVLLEARRLWAARVYDLLKEKKTQRINIIISIMVSLFLCSMIYMITLRMNFALANYKITQIVTMLVLMVDYFILYMADKKLCVDVLYKKKEDEKRYLDTYNRINAYDESKFFDRLGKRTAIKSMTRKIEREYPKWLLEVALLLQSENVAVAIFKSCETAPMVLQPYLRELVARIQREPDSMLPYNDFLKDYQLPEVHSAMKMLYSISEGTGGSATSQIAEMLKQNEKLLDKAEKLKNDDVLAGLYALFLAPQITAGCKLMVDMMVLLVLYLGRMGSQTMYQCTAMFC